jgi:predicted RNA polymerase sigma factor
MAKLLIDLLLFQQDPFHSFRVLTRKARSANGLQNQNWLTFQIVQSISDETPKSPVSTANRKILHAVAQERTHGPGDSKGRAMARTRKLRAQLLGHVKYHFARAHLLDVIQLV